MAPYFEDQIINAGPPFALTRPNIQPPAQSPVRDALEQAIMARLNTWGQRPPMGPRPVDQFNDYLTQAKKDAARNAMNMALMRGGLSILSQGPSRVPISTLQTVSTGALAGLDAYDQQYRQQVAEAMAQKRAELEQQNAEQSMDMQRQQHELGVLRMLGDVRKDWMPPKPQVHYGEMVQGEDGTWSIPVFVDGVLDHMQPMGIPKSLADNIQRERLAADEKSHDIAAVLMDMGVSPWAKSPEDAVEPGSAISKAYMEPYNKMVSDEARKAYYNQQNIGARAENKNMIPVGMDSEGTIYYQTPGGVQNAKGNAPKGQLRPITKDSKSGDGDTSRDIMNMTRLDVQTDKELYAKYGAKGVTFDSNTGTFVFPPGFDQAMFYADRNRLRAAKYKAAGYPPPVTLDDVAPPEAAVSKHIPGGPLPMPPLNKSGAKPSVSKEDAIAELRRRGVIK